jgi:hypothetical protein
MCGVIIPRVQSHITKERISLGSTMNQPNIET